MNRIVKVSTETCQPCKRFKPTWDAAKDNYPNWVFEEVDAEVDPVFVSKFKISAVPTFIVFEGKLEVDRWSGANPQRFYDALNSV